MQKTVLASLLLSVSLGAWAAQPLASEADTKTLCQTIGETLNQPILNAAGAVDVVEPYWLFKEDELAAQRLLNKQQLEWSSERWGNPMGVALIKSQTIQNTFLKHTYLLKREKHALILECSFYRPKDKWWFNSYYWHDAVSNLFDR